MSFPKIEGYVVTEKLGSGSYSTVYKAYTKVGAKFVVAIKCVDKSRIKHSGSAVDNLITEIRLLKTLTHPHIVHMRNFTWDDKNIYIIMEYCCGGDLSKYILRYGRVPEKQVLYFLQQLASALKFLREKGVVHMDLKPHNLLLHKGSDGKYTLKVADFGFARHLSAEDARGVRGSPLYMAPEMVEGGHYDAAVDLWSVGVIMYECLFGKAPYSSTTLKELVEKFRTRAPIEIPRNASISAGCQDLLTSLLKHDPCERITYEQFFAHEYLDLEHMPSKENYDKAVTLINRAIKLDSAGQLSEAFQLYRDSLLYLVPVVNCESDPVRRSALRAKLTRYMERAEDIKQYLRGQDAPSDVTRRPQYNSSNTCDYSQLDPTPHNAQREPSAAAALDRACNSCHNNGQTEICNGKEETAEGSGTSNTTPPRAKTPKVQLNKDPHRERSPARFGIMRFFSRQQSIPYLDTKDSSIADDSNENGKAQKVGETTNDVCKIT